MFSCNNVTKTKKSVLFGLTRLFIDPLTGNEQLKAGYHMPADTALCTQDKEKAQIRPSLFWLHHQCFDIFKLGIRKMP